MSTAREASRTVQTSDVVPAQTWQPAWPAPVPAGSWFDGLRVGRTQARTALQLVLVLGAAGIPVGLAWLLLAPRREYEVVEGGLQALEPQSEAVIGADAWLTILTAVLGITAAGLVWRFARARGVGIVLGLTAGMLLASVVAWQVGEWSGSGSSPAQTSKIGAVVTASLQLRAVPVLVIGAFVATLTYLIVVTFARRDDLERRQINSISSDWKEPPTEAGGPGPLAERSGQSTPGATDATAPQAGLPSRPRPAAPGDPAQ